jgi:rhodanese-related sulfurtransferase
MAVRMGYTNVSVYRDGLIGWMRSGKPVTSEVVYPDVDIPLVSSDTFPISAGSNTGIIDIRPESHYQKGHIKGSINIDLEILHESLDRLPKDKQIILIDHKGKLTLTTGRYLYSEGFKDIMRLDGGFNAWVKSGQSVCLRECH